jgi:hypothetical protein
VHTPPFHPLTHTASCQEIATSAATVATLSRLKDTPLDTITIVDDRNPEVILRMMLSVLALPVEYSAETLATVLTTQEWRLTLIGSRNYGMVVFAFLSVFLFLPFFFPFILDDLVHLSSWWLVLARLVFDLVAIAKVVLFTFCYLVRI